MIRALTILLVCMLCAACEDDDCPVCPAPPPAPAELTGTWEASYFTRDGFTDRVDWIFTQNDSSVTAIVQHGILHNEISTDTVSGVMHHDGFLEMRVSKDDGFTTSTLVIGANMNASHDFCMGQITHIETEMSHSVSYTQPFNAERK